MVPQLHAAPEALPGTGEARAFNNWLGERRRRLDDISAPTGPSAALRARQAPGRRTRGGRSCRAVIGKALRSHGFNQRPRFEQVVGYIEQGLLGPDRVQ